MIKLSGSSAYDTKLGKGYRSAWECRAETSCRTTVFVQAFSIMLQRKLRNIGLVAAVLALAACSTPIGQNPSTTNNPFPSSTLAPATPTTTATADPPADPEWPSEGPIEPGTHHLAPSEWSVAGLTLTIPEGWETELGPPTGIKHADRDGELAFYFVTVDRIFSDPCEGIEGEKIGPSVGDLVTALVEQPVTETSEPVDTTLGGLPATQILLTVPAGFDTTECNASVGLQIWYSQPADKYLVALADGTVAIYILDVNGERQVFYTQHRVGTSANDLDEMRIIQESIHIDA